MWIGALSPILRPRPAHGLTVNRDDPFGEARHRGDPGDEAVLELFGIERCEDVANPVVDGGVPSLKGRKRRSRASFFSPKRAMSVKVSAPASVPNNASNSTSSSG